MSFRTFQCLQSTPQTHFLKKKAQLLKIHLQLPCFVAAQHRELGTAGRSKRYLQPKTEVGRAEQRKPALSPWICIIPTMFTALQLKKRHQGIRKTSDLGGGTRMINAVEGQGYDMVK